MKAEVNSLYGVPTIVLDGKPVSGLMHWTKTPTEDDTAFFRDADIHFYSFMGNLNVPAPAGIPTEDLDIRDGGLPRMLMTCENIDRVMSMLVRVDPRIRVLPRIIMNPPLWWEKRHPEELMCYYRFVTGDYQHGPRASLASDHWNTLWQAELRRTVAYFEERWGEYVFGYHTGLGHCGEHTYQWWDHAADFSKVNRGAFRKWLKQEYGSIDGLNRAWRKEFISFEEILLPNGKDFADFGPRAHAFFSPGQEQPLIDFQRFSSDAMADTLLKEARVVKSELARRGSRKLYGAFYGYLNLVANSTQCMVGHSALTRVLESEDVDFLCGPLSYGARQNGGVALPQLMPNSITLHGKAFYNEDDTGTHLFHGSHHGYVPETAADSVAVERRNFLETWSSGGSLWWMDLYGSKWFLAPELQAEFARLHSFAEAHLDDRASRSEIAVFVSPTSLLYMRDTPVPLSGNLIEQQLFEIASCGAPFDLYQDEDLPLLAKSGKLAQYKLCIFPNLLAPSPKVCEIIDRVLKQAGRTLLWFYMPGYCKGTEPGKTNAEALTGIRFSVVDDGIMPMLTEFWHGEERFTYGLSRAVYPRFSANDPAAEELGYFVNGTTIAGQPCGSGAAMVAKVFPGWRSVWSSSPGMPASELRNIAKAAGVHIYTNDGAQVFRGTGWLGVHAKRSGILTIALPECGRWRDGVTGQSCPVSDRLTVELQRGQTAYWVMDDEIKTTFITKGGKMKKQLFTLIELLVVVAIIVILAALLLPAIGKARDRAKMMGCTNNLNNIGKAILSYSGDYEDYNVKPGSEANNGWQGWVGSLCPYLGIPTFSFDALKKSVFADPAVLQGIRYSSTSSVDNRYNFHYGMCVTPQIVFCFQSGNSPWKLGPGLYRYKITRIKKASNVAIVSDTLAAGTTGTGTTPIGPYANPVWAFWAYSGGTTVDYLDWYRHSGQSNWLYYDGHVKSFTKVVFWSNNKSYYGGNVGSAFRD